jgi:hypothetical protein
VNSKNNSVDVIADIGLTYRNIPVMSREWVCASDEKNYVSAERYLPPIGARVFVLTPTQSVTGGFVLCSGFARGETKTHSLYAADDTEVETKNAECERVSQGGWNEKEDYETGNLQKVSSDGNVAIALNPVENQNKSQKKSVSIVAWGSEICIDDEGIAITVPDEKGMTLKIDGDCTVEANGDCVVKSANVDVSANSKIGLKAGSTLEIGQTSATLGSFISQFMAAFQTAFVTGQVTISPDFVMKIATLKQQWEAVFK